MLDVGVIGTGAIGSAVVRQLSEGLVPTARVTSLFNRTPDRAHALVDSLDAADGITVAPAPVAVTERTDVVVETAGQGFVESSAVDLVGTGTDLVLMSVGAFRDRTLLARVREAADRTGARVLVPSGAITGLDGIRALGNGSFDAVEMTASRPPAYLGAFVDGSTDPSALPDGEVLFEGTANEAAATYPSHMNVAIALTLAAKVDPEDVAVRVVVDRDVPRARFVIRARGPVGSIEVENTNVATPETPDTSWLNVYAVIETLRRLAEPVTIGT